jgi:hypothetical protein
MAFAAEKLGCKIEVSRKNPWEEAWELLKGYVGKHIPVYMPMLNMQHLWKTAFPVPHIVLFCGYDEAKGVVMIHDPGLGEIGEGIQYLPMQYLPPDGLREGELFEGKSGAYAEFKIDDFKKACDLEGTAWGDVWKNGLAVISPPSGQPTLPWPEVIKRNGKLSLGMIENVVGENPGDSNSYGPEGIMALAADIERGFGLFEKPEALAGILGGLSGVTFRVGSTYRRDGDSFLAGLGATTNNEYLVKASYHLRAAALYYDQGLAEIEPILKKGPALKKDLSNAVKRIAELLRRIAECERKAGEILISASKVLG